MHKFISGTITGAIISMALQPNLTGVNANALDSFDKYILDVASFTKIPAERLASHLYTETKMNHLAKGDNGNAIGMGQIWEIAEKDVNNYYRMELDRSDKYQNILIAALYLRMQKERYNADSWKEASFQYNAGPNKQYYESGYVKRIEKNLSHFFYLTINN